MSRTNHVCGAFIAGLLLAVWCSGCSMQVATSARAEPGDPASQAEQSPEEDLTAVTTLSPQTITLQRTTTQPATICAYYQAEVYAKVGGYLETLGADIGQQVDAGAVLATIAVPEMDRQREKQEATIRCLEAEVKRAEAEVAVAEASVESAKASLEQARADVSSTQAQLKADRTEYDRFNELVQSKAVAERLGDEALKRFSSAQAQKSGAQAAVGAANANLSLAGAKLEAARADLAAAQARTEVATKELEELGARIAYAILKSPFKGIVTQRHVDPGDLIRNSPTSSGPDSPPLFVIADLDKVRVRITLPEGEAPWADEGDAVTLVLPALPNRKFEGKIDRIARSVDESTRTMTVEVDLPNPDHVLLPGMYGEATVELNKKEGALVLPAGAVRYDEEGHSRVYVVDKGNTVAVVDVSTGLDDGNQIEILSGLDESARVVGPLVGRLTPGQRVKVQGG